MKLFHSSCVEKKENLTIGNNMITYSCIDCRSLSKDIGKVLEELKSVREMLDGRIKKCDELSAENAKLMCENVKIKAENEQLKKNEAQSYSNNAKSNQRVPVRSAMIKPGSNEVDERLLCGSSIVRDFRDTDGLKVTSIGGAGIEKIEEVIDASNIKDYKKITIEAGSIDCMEENIESGKVLDRYEHLITKVHSKKGESAVVEIASVVPQTQSKARQEIIDNVNHGLKVLCESMDCMFIDNDLKFKNRDNDVCGALFKDGLHLNNYGNLALMESLKLPKESLVTARENQRTNGRYGGVHGNRSGGECFFCGVRGHKKDKCWHGKPVRCHKCHMLGHKQAFCK